MCEEIEDDQSKSNFVSGFTYTKLLVVHTQGAKVNGFKKLG